MKLGKLLVLFLIPVALFFVSCENEIPEEFLFEYDPATNNYFTLDDADYFLLTLIKLPDGEMDFSQEIQQGTVSTYTTVNPPIFTNKRLNKGELLRLEGLEPGKYKLTGGAYHLAGPGYPDYIVGSITGKGNKMDENGNIIIDDISPTIVKLVFYCDLH